MLGPCLDVTGSAAAATLGRGAPSGQSWRQPVLTVALQRRLHSIRRLPGEGSASASAATAPAQNPGGIATAISRPTHLACGDPSLRAP